MAAEEGTVIACHTKQDFEAQMLKVIIDFTASWCGPCRIIAPVFAEYAKKFTAAIFLKVDVDELKDVAAEYEVEAMPTFLFIKDGEKVDTVVGGRKDDIQAKLVALTGSGSTSASA